MTDYTQQAHKLGSLCQDDASKWAEAFCQIRAKVGFPVDQDNMLGWFANAIEISNDHRRGDTMTMEEARGIAARAWCEPSTSGIEMDVILAEEFAKILVAQSAS